MARHCTPVMVTFFLLWNPGNAIAETRQSPHKATGRPLVRQVTTTVTQEQFMVWGHRKLLFPAPMPDNHVPEPGDQTGFGPGSELGIATIEGGPRQDQLHDGVVAGITIPLPGVRNLDFTFTATGSRDAMSASGTVGAASATAGLRLKF